MKKIKRLGFKKRRGKGRTRLVGGPDMNRESKVKMLMI